MRKTSGTHFRPHPRILWFCLSLCIWLQSDEVQAQATSAAKQNTGPVVVSVRSLASVDDRDVTIADVAMIEGGDARLREQIGKLDLADAPRFGQPLRISQELVSYRIQLAGFDRRAFQVQGDRNVAVTLRSYEVPAQDIVAAARLYLLTRLPWNPEDITIQTSQPIRGPVPIPGTKDDVRLEASLRSSRAPLGSVRVEVAILSKGKKLAEVPVSLDVQLYQTIAISSRRIERGQNLTDENLYFERRAVDAMTDYVPSSESPVGQRAKRLILPLQAITKADLEPAEPTSPIVIKQRDVVQLVARAGGLVISAAGEAMQNGREGEMIRVQNVDSKKIVTGRVVSRTEVRVLY